MEPKIYTYHSAEDPEYLDSIEDHGHFFLVRLKGSLDTPALEKNREKMTTAIQKINLFEKHNIADLSQVEVADTAAVAAIFKRFVDFKGNENKKMIFFNVSESLRNIFDLAKLSDVFTICETKEEAIQKIS